MPYTRIIVLLLALLILLTGCEKSPQEALLTEREKSPEEARRELGQLNIPYTEKAFLEAAWNGDILAIKLFLDAGMNPNCRGS